MFYFDGGFNNLQNLPPLPNDDEFYQDGSDDGSDLGNSSMADVAFDAAQLNPGGAQAALHEEVSFGSDWEDVKINPAEAKKAQNIIAAQFESLKKGMEAQGRDVSLLDQFLAGGRHVVIAKHSRPSQKELGRRVTPTKRDYDDTDGLDKDRHPVRPFHPAEKSLKFK